MNACKKNVGISNARMPARLSPICALAFGTIALLTPWSDASAWTINFKPHVDYATGGGPLADLNRDDKLDLVAPDGVWLGKGDGTFQLKAGSATGGGQLADLNRDGILDLLLSSNGVRLGKGDGTFRPKIGSATGGVPLADLNRDGLLDLVFTSVTYDEVSGEYHNFVNVQLGKGDGTFHPSKVDEFGVGLPIGVQIADLNRDGKPDLMIRNSDNTGSVLLGKGDGTFLAKGSFAAVGGELIEVVDMNRDSKLDLVFSETILLGKGDGTFLAKLDYATEYPPGVAVADLNRDGKLDVVSASGGGYCSYDGGSDNYGWVGVRLGNGDGTLRPAVGYDVGALLPSSVKVADLNRDGKPDLVFTSEIYSGGGDECDYSYWATVLLGKGDGTFLAKLDFPTNYAWGLAVADLNRDGKLDLITTGWGHSVLLNAGP